MEVNFRIRVDLHHYFHTEAKPPSPNASFEHMVLESLSRLEFNAMKKDEAFQAIKAQNDVLRGIATDGFKSIGESLENIKADEARQTEKLNQLDDLSPAQQAIVDEVLADSKTFGEKVQAAADAVKGVADALPEPIEVEP